MTAAPGVEIFAYLLALSAGMMAWILYNMDRSDFEAKPMMVGWFGAGIVLCLVMLAYLIS